MKTRTSPAKVPAGTAKPSPEQVLEIRKAQQLISATEKVMHAAKVRLKQAKKAFKQAKKATKKARKALKGLLAKRTKANGKQDAEPRRKSGRATRSKVPAKPNKLRRPAKTLPPKPTLPTTTVSSAIPQS